MKYDENQSPGNKLVFGFFLDLLIDVIHAWEESKRTTLYRITWQWILQKAKDNMVAYTFMKYTYQKPSIKHMINS